MDINNAQLEWSDRWGGASRPEKLGWIKGHPETTLFTITRQTMAAPCWLSGAFIPDDVSGLDELSEEEAKGLAESFLAQWVDTVGKGLKGINGRQPWAGALDEAQLDLEHARKVSLADLQRNQAVVNERDALRDAAAWAVTYHHMDGEEAVDRLQKALELGSKAPQQRRITLTAAQLRDALQIVNPDDNDADAWEYEVTIEWCPARKSVDGEDLAEGYYAILTEYPEEGCYGPLGTKEPNDGIDTSLPPDQAIHIDLPKGVRMSALLFSGGYESRLLWNHITADHCSKLETSITASYNRGKLTKLDVAFYMSLRRTEADHLGNMTEPFNITYHYEGDGEELKPVFVDLGRFNNQPGLHPMSDSMRCYETLKREGPGYSIPIPNGGDEITVRVPFAIVRNEQAAAWTLFKAEVQPVEGTKS